MNLLDCLKILSLLMPDFISVINYITPSIYTEWTSVVHSVLNCYRFSRMPSTLILEMDSHIRNYSPRSSLKRLISISSL